MNCVETHDLLLEADPETLAGNGDPAVAAHLQSCAQCRSVVAQLLEAHERDVALYVDVTPRQTPDAVATMVIAAAVGDVPVRKRRSIRRAVGIGLVPIAAAAAFLLAIHTRRDARQEAFQASIDAAFAAPAAVTSVKIPAGKNAVVFKTQDPNISVVWIY